MEIESKNKDFNPNGLGIASGARATADKAASGMSREVTNFVADVEDLITATTALTGEQLLDAKARVGRQLSSAKASVEKMTGVVNDSARKAATETNTYVHAQPWNAIGIGAVAGFLLGLVVARRA